MKISLIFTILFLFATLPPCQASELIGVYQTRPDVFPGFQKPYSDTIKSAIEKLTWILEIKENEIILKMNPNHAPTAMQYKVEGNYGLAIETDTELEKYVPFYIDSQNALHGIGQIFFKIK